MYKDMLYLYHVKLIKHKAMTTQELENSERIQELLNIHGIEITSVVSEEILEYLEEDDLIDMIYESFKTKKQDSYVRRMVSENSNRKEVLNYMID